MSITELNALAATTAAATANVEGITAQATLRGLIADEEGQALVNAIHERKAFDRDAPLPPLNIRPQNRLWEPAAVHYRDLEQKMTHTCTSQCDDCHTLDNCIEATRRLDELLLCADCYGRRRP